MEQYTLNDSDSEIRLRGAWEQTLRRLKTEVPPAWYDRFVTPITPSGYDEGVVTLCTPSRFHVEWIEKRYLDKIEEFLSDELGEPTRVLLQFEPRDRRQEVSTAPSEAAVASLPPQEGTSLRLNDRYRFDTFVVGQSNRMAYAGAKQVAENPGGQYNPLFIYGASGLGKTHLLHSIAREILSRRSAMQVVYISAQQFAEQFVFALQNNRIEQFRRAQRAVGVWLLDDVQFIAGKDKTQEEVFHTFNYLHSLGKQIVICSDRPPHELSLLDERLSSRFEAGLVADIQPPDTETRCAIALAKAKQDGIELSTEVAMYLAENVPGNVRILEGAITKVAAQASLDARPIDLEIAAQVVDSYYKSREYRPPSLEHIVARVGKQFNVGVEEIYGPSRKARIVHARHIAVFLTRELTKDSWKNIGSQFGNRDHTSMMHAHQKISEMMLRDRELRSSVKALLRELHPGD